MQRALDAGKIVETIVSLGQRISERFPGSGLSGVAAELLAIGRQAIGRSEKIQKANVPLRVGIGVLIIAIPAVLVNLAIHLKVDVGVPDLSNLVQTVEAAVETAVFVGAGAIFLATLEARLKRRRALKAIYELRALSHIVDMHQLTKYPERIHRQGPSTPSSPRRVLTPFELTRYLDYCAELLSLISKIGVLYVQRFDDPVALEAVDQLEDLTNGLSRKIWQKITILDRSIENPAARVPERALAEAGSPRPEGEDRDGSGGP